MMGENGRGSDARSLAALRFVRHFRELITDESANALPEYALVLASLTLIAMAAFYAVGNSSTNAMETNANNLGNSGTANYTNSGSP